MERGRIISDPINPIFKDSIEARKWSEALKEALEGCSAYDVVNSAIRLHLEIEMARAEVERAYINREISLALRDKYNDELVNYLEQLIDLPTNFDKKCECKTR